MEVKEDNQESNSNTTQQDQNYDEYKQRWMEEQLTLKQQLTTHDDFDWYIPDDNNSNNNESNKKPLELIGGVDISFIKDNNVDACASLIVMSYPSFEIVYKDFQMVKLELPYIPSFLGFREVPFLLQLINILKTTHPELIPQVILVDGNGMLHPRGFGTACHLGVLSGIPTIGIGKTFFIVENVTVDDYKRMEKTLQPKQSINVVGASGTVWGALFRSTKDSVKSITVSIGHKISLETALKVISVCSMYRIPEPVRQADLLSRDYIRQHPM